MNKSKLILSSCVFVAASSAAYAQAAHEPFEAPAAAQEHHDAVHSAFDAWNGEHGGNWHLAYDVATGSGRSIYGGALAAAFTPDSDADFFALARTALALSSAIHRIEAATLVEDEHVFLPLGNAGSTDKHAVQFRQQVGGVPVIGGFVNVLFDAGGRALSIDASGLPGLAGFATSPSISAERAAEIAGTLFARDERLAATRVGLPELAIDGPLDGKFRRPVLVWRVQVAFEQSDMAPAGFEYRIDALDGRLSSRHTSIHHFDVSGNVKSLASPGLAPDTTSNPETQQNVVNALVTSAQGNATTDASGNFVIVGATEPVDVTVEYSGAFCNTGNQAASDYSLTQTLAQPSGNSLLMNPTSDAFTTAEANAFVWANKLRDWTRAVNPADNKADFVNVCNVNIASSCNAYYNGTSTNYYQAGGGCANTAYSTIVAHETGHWLNARYGSGNGADGFGEGNADVFAMYLADNAIVGLNFCGTNCNVRTGNNLRAFCGDCCTGCYGEVHNDGEVLMGALWKVRARLKAALGASAGIAAADTLFNGWMNAYNDGTITTAIETHWLTLDDDDGNIGNGTPNYAHIDGGFRDQGFPGFVLTYVAIANVTQLPDTQDQTGPYVVNADLTAPLSPPVASATLRYRVNGGAYASLPMSPVAGNTWSAAIPGQNCTSHVDYYVTASDSTGGTNSFPAAAPASVLDFAVANVSTVFLADFESGVAGWTHAQVATQDDWQISSQFGVNASYGKAGDPTAATSGTNIWGNDLGPSGYNGLYGANVSNYLRSPLIDCTGVQGARLRFNRWLRVENSVYDFARVKVNGNVIWTNPASADLLDTSWVAVEYDISAYADNNPAVQIEFSLVTDAGLQYGGWNLDDVAIISYGTCSTCPPPVSYCTAKVTSLGQTPQIGSTGVATLSSNNLALTLSNAPPNRQALCFWGDARAATPFWGGFYCVQSPVHRLSALQTTAAGTASNAVPIDAAMVGTQRHYQWWFRDPPDPFHVGLSGGLTVDFCN